MVDHDRALAPCPNCGAEWRRTEMVSAAHRGGGYHLLCHACGHEWDDRHASHHARAAASVSHEPPVILNPSMSERPRLWCLTHDCWDGDCGVLGQHEVEPRHEVTIHAHVPWFARLRARILGRSKTVYFGSNRHPEKGAR